MFKGQVPSPPALPLPSPHTEILLRVNILAQHLGLPKNVVGRFPPNKMLSFELGVHCNHLYSIFKMKFNIKKLALGQKARTACKMLRNMLLNLRHFVPCGILG